MTMLSLTSLILTYITNITASPVHHQHINGTHLHWYREGYAHLEWAEAIDWYDANKPMETLFKFLDLIETRFPRGIQEVLL